MAADKYQPHLVVLLEDKANRQIYNGFAMHSRLRPRRMHPEPIVGGWEKVLEKFKDEHVALMRQFPLRHLLLVIDFDDETAAQRLQQRMEKFRESIPADLNGRVFVIGCSETPERLTADLGISKERVGAMLAEDCESGTDHIWGHEMLRHNAAEVTRLRTTVNPFLFPAVQA